jgi:hypothetical protein
MPGAWRTRSLVCAWGNKYAHEYSQRGRQNHPASPRNGFNGCSVLSPVIGLSCHRRLRGLHRLDAGVEASGPHVLAVRFRAVRYRHIHVHRIPHSTFVTIAIRPSSEAGQHDDAADLGQTRSEIFLQRRVDR